MQWQLTADWAANSSPLGFVPAGEILTGVTDRTGTLTDIRWQGQSFGTALPLEACACDQAAADVLSTQFPEQLFLLRATPPAIIRPLINVG